MRWTRVAGGLPPDARDARGGAPARRRRWRARWPAIGVTDAAGWEAREDVTQAAMFALATARYAIPTSAALAGYAFAWAEATTSAAVRLVPSGRAPGSGCWRRPATRSPTAVERARALDDDELAATAPGQAIASALHEALYSRLFRS